MPDGAKALVRGEGGEGWAVPGSLDQVKAAMRALLDVGGSVQGYPWCASTPGAGPGGIAWFWGDRGGDGLSVYIYAVSPDDIRVDVEPLANLSPEGCSTG